MIKHQYIQILYDLILRKTSLVCYYFLNIGPINKGTANRIFKIFFINNSNLIIIHISKHADYILFKMLLSRHFIIDVLSIKSI